MLIFRNLNTYKHSNYIFSPEKIAFFFVWANVILLLPYLNQASVAQEISAPSDSLKVELSATAPPVNITLKNWYCHKLDDTGSRLDATKRADSLTVQSVKDRVEGAADPFVKYAIYARNNWGYDLGGIFSAISESELIPSLILRKLTAPQGKTEVFTKKNCYTKSDVNIFIRQVANQVTDKMNKIREKLKASPYDFTEEQFLEAGWYTAPPQKFKTTPIRQHTITISINRLKSGDGKQPPNIDENEAKLPPPPPSSEIEKSKAEKSDNSNICSFNGMWDSYLGNISLKQTGSSITGMADYQSTKFDGEVNGRVMTGYWMTAPYKSKHGTKGGDIILTLAADCNSYSSKWRYGTQESGDDFYGWVSWPAKRKVAAKKDTSNIPAPDFTSLNLAGKAGENVALQQQISEINEASEELTETRQLWKILSEQINEQRAKGNDVVNLQRNLNKINGRRQQARKDLVALTNKYGSTDDIEKKIEALSLASKPSASAKGSKSETDEPSDNDSDLGNIKIPFTMPDIDIFRKTARDKPKKDRKTDTHKASPPLSKAPNNAQQMTEEMGGWTIYKVKTLSRRADHLPNLEVIEIEFNSNADRASLITKNYPLLLVQNQQGQILWSINWQNSKITETHNATSHNDIISLGQVAQKNKPASVPIEELDTLINNTIGPKARKKK